MSSTAWQCVGSMTSGGNPWSNLVPGMLGSFLSVWVLHAALSLRGKQAWHLCGNKVVVDLKEHHQAGHNMYLRKLQNHHDQEAQELL